jgi:DNA-binding NarL/FixJ family response regulator
VSTDTLRVAICEDDERYRAQLVKHLALVPHFLLVGQWCSGEETCRELAEATPDVVLLDLELPGIDGLEVLKRLRMIEQVPEVLILTTFAEEGKVFAAVKAGAAGYLVKHAGNAGLQQAIEDVARGGVVIDGRLARRFWHYFSSCRGVQELPVQLTEVERQVLALIGRGLSNPEVANVLDASRRSIKGHLERIYRKLGVASRVEAVVKALNAGLINI